MLEQTEIEAPEAPEAPEVQSTMSSAPTGQLTSSDVLSKMEAGLPLYEGEQLPKVPKGVPAKAFFGQFPGGASAYTMAFGSPNVLDPSYGDTFSSIPNLFDRPEQDTSTVQPPQEEPVMDTMDAGDTLDYTGQDEDYTYQPFSDAISPLDQYAVDFPDFKEIVTNVENFEVKNELNNFLVQGTDRLIKAVDDGVESFKNEISDIGATIEEFADGPFDFVVKEVKSELKEIELILKNPFSAETVDKAATSIVKMISSEALSTLFRSMGLGSVAGPLGMFAVMFLSGNATQIGMPGVAYEGDSFDPSNPIDTTIAGYNKYGIGVDYLGRPVHVDTPGSVSTGSPWGWALKNASNFGTNPTKEQNQEEADRLTSSFNWSEDITEASSQDDDFWSNMDTEGISEEDKQQAAMDASTPYTSGTLDESAGEDTGVSSEGSIGGTGMGEAPGAGEEGESFW